MLSRTSAAVGLVALVGSIELAAAQILARGQYFQAGNINANWRWQASGQLVHNRCPFTIPIKDCYTSNLAATGMLQETTEADYLASLNGGALAARATSAPVLRRSGNMTLAQEAAELRAMMDDEDLDSYFEAFPEQMPYRFPMHAMYEMGPSFKAKRQVIGCGTGGGSTTPGTSTTTSAPPGTSTPPVASPRQRNEIFTWPGAIAGETWKYTWKSWQSRTTSSNYNFFHAWQILRRDGCGGAVITLDYIDGEVVIRDAVRNCKTCSRFLKGTQNWFGNEVRHELQITYGLSGSITYRAWVAPNFRQPQLIYTATGDMGSSASLKFGNYRRYTDGQTAAMAYLGDFTMTRLA
ncbi:uncharacterized protein JCM10292_001179 [Rhodotorula paludigena]|uniref:uncharacterized protein n=1 Tax=Rhodotorula paludigena TaxID=86838 RepID=UPI00317E1EC3